MTPVWLVCLTPLTLGVCMQMVVLVGAVYKNLFLYYLCVSRLYVEH